MNGSARQRGEAAATARTPTLNHTVHLEVVGGNRVGAAWGLPAAPACAVPDTADRPLRFAAQAGHAVYTGSLHRL
ncbi:MAG: hypothetical protein BWX48_01169 [Verrucomicrobia bacterium ADurb.Bin006]|nr:MAG: hypothetical protein BWX48_01169 [Verrucomicrobia bacterium ADurb.Bin006]